MSQEKKIYISEAFAEGKIDRKLRMLEGVARILSDNYNVTVVFSPDGECKTSQEVMTLPYDKGVDEALILGLCGHETGHLKYTEFAIGRVIARHKKIHNRALLYVVFNVLEDVRIEREMENVYPGFKEMFKRLLPYIKEKKQPILDREEKIKRMTIAGKSERDIEIEIERCCEIDLMRLERALKTAGFSQEYIKFELEQLKRAQEAPLPEVQKVLDVIYLMLRKYDYKWYPVETIDFVKKNLIETSKEVYDCKNSQEVLDVAIKVYQLLTDNDERLKNPKKGKEEDQSDEGEGEEEGEEQEEGEREGEGQAGQEGEESKERSNSTLRVKLGQTLKVGSKVTHLNNSTRKGVVTKINNTTSEVEVEWN
jgi:hypothetical protein